MKRLVSLLLIMLIAAQSLISASAEEDVIDSINLLEKYTTAQIVDMYPELSQFLAGEFRKHNADISVEKFAVKVDVINSIYLSVLCENPDIFYVNPKNFESTSSFDDGTLVSIRPFYLYDSDETAEKTREFDKAVEYFLDGVDESWSDFYKCRFLHDKLATSISYTEKIESAGLDIYTAYGALVQNSAVCEGYTLAYNFLLSKLGIEAHYIQSIKARHSWSLVKISGKYFHVDVTLDDPLYDNLGRVNHTFFMTSDSLLRQNDVKTIYTNMHTDWVCPYSASSTEYDKAWWRDISTIIFRVNGYDYFVRQTYGSSVYAALMKRDDNGTEKLIERITTRWNVYGEDEDTFWEKAFCYLAYDGTYFYYNSTVEVFRTKPDSTYFEIIYTRPSTIDYNIYGLAFEPNGSMCVSIKESPNVPDTVYQLESILPESYNYEDPETIRAEYYTPVEGGIKLLHFDVYNENIIIPEQFDGNTVVGLADELLMNNQAIKSVIISDSLKTIGAAAFYGCSNLERIVIPKNVTEIGMNAFAGCTKLTIEGYRGSAAEEYAREYGIHFVEVGSAPKPTSPTKATTPTNPTTPKSSSGTNTTTTKTTLKHYKVTVSVYEDEVSTLPKAVRTGSVKYTVKNKKIASVSAKGKVTGKKKGKTTITAKAKKYTAKITVRVKAAKLNAKKKTLKRGKSFTLKIKGTSKLVSFKSSNKKVAAVSYNGKVKAKRKGSATITVKYGSKKLKCKIKVV